jgi:hypothetical protein
VKEDLATKAKGRGMTRLSRSTLRFRPAPDVPVLSWPGPAEAIGKVHGCKINRVTLANHDHARTWYGVMDGGVRASCRSGTRKTHFDTCVWRIPARAGSPQPRQGSFGVRKCLAA